MKKPAVRVNKLTELEGAVLGTIFGSGPCTPYRARQPFLESPSPYWSGSAGAIYPVIKRLAERKLIKAESTATGRRAATEYRISNQGVTELMRWVTDAGEVDSVIGVPMDPLRTRLTFLSSLSPSKQRRLLSRVATRLRSVEQAVVTDAAEKKGTDIYAFITARGAAIMSRARTQWIREFQTLMRRRK